MDKQAYLTAMGIDQWQLRTKPVISRLLIVSAQDVDGNGELIANKRELLDKILQAINWPKATCKIWVKGMSPWQPDLNLKAGIEFGSSAKHPALTQHKDGNFPLAIVHSLSQLLTDQAAKKAAWKVLQRL